MSEKVSLAIDTPEKILLGNAVLAALEAAIESGIDHETALLILLTCVTKASAEWFVEPSEWIEDRAVSWLRSCKPRNSLN